MTPTHPPILPTQASFATYWRRLYGHLGFQKHYNFLLWCILGLGVIVSHTLGHVAKLDYFGVFCRRNHLDKGRHAAPGECYYFLNGGREQFGMMLHIYTIIPCCLLVVFQFLPPILRRRQQQQRRVMILFHRINGYVILVLMVAAVAGGFVASSGSFGGELSWQVLVWSHGMMVITGLGLSITHIKKLQIEEHRVWMLRTWTWAFSAITMRIFQQLGAHMVSGKGYFSLRSCAQIFSDGVVPEPVITMRWPECTAYLSGQIPDQTVLVAANYSGLPIEANVALSIVAGPAGWLSLLIHMIGVEVYLHLAASETDRLCQVSDIKQVGSDIRPLEGVRLAVNRFGSSGKSCPRVDKKFGLVDKDVEHLVARTEI